MGYHDHAVTVFLISWGQAIDHDMTFTADTKGPSRFRSNFGRPNFALPLDSPSFSFSEYFLFARTDRQNRSRDGHGPALLRRPREQTQRRMLPGRDPVRRPLLRPLPSPLHGVCPLGFLSQRRMQIR
jgi:hypothetical protein